MSTCYRCIPPLPFADFLAGLSASGLSISDHPDATDKDVCVTDGSDFIWASTGDGSDTGFTRYGGNFGEGIIDEICEHFDVDILSEHDDGYFEDEENGDV